MTKTTIGFAAALATALAAGCFSERVSEPEDTTACTSSATTECAVTMTDNSFMPATIRVSAGSTVTWHNEGNATHTSTGDDWDSGSVGSEGEYERPFPAAGTFDYECIFHSGMEGTVIVE